MNRKSASNSFYSLGILVLIFSSSHAFAQRVKPPVINSGGGPHGSGITVTRVDFIKKEKDKEEREKKEAELKEQEDNAASEVAREAAKLEREALKEAAKQLAEQEKQLRQSKPEDFVADATKVAMTAGPKASSVNEVVVTNVTVVAAAQKVITRRAR